MDEKAWRGKLCNRVRELRREIGLSQMEFANRADLSYHTIGKIERREVFPNLGTLIRLSEAHRIPMTEFFGEPAMPSTRREKTTREIHSVLRGRDERKLELALGLLRKCPAKRGPGLTN
jgi:transcriptional regulator with XRE-family HTH domain